MIPHWRVIFSKDGTTCELLFRTDEGWLNLSRFLQSLEVRYDSYDAPTLSFQFSKKIEEVTLEEFPFQVSEKKEGNYFWLEHVNSSFEWTRVQTWLTRGLPGIGWMFRTYLDDVEVEYI